MSSDINAWRTVPNVASTSVLHVLLVRARFSRNERRSCVQSIAECPYYLTTEYLDENAICDKRHRWDPLAREREEERKRMRKVEEGSRSRVT